MDGRRPSVLPLRQGQFAALDPEPAGVGDELVEGADEEEGEDDDEDDDDSEAGVLDDPSELPLLEGVSLALEALRLSVR